MKFFKASLIGLFVVILTLEFLSDANAQRGSNYRTGGGRVSTRGAVTSSSRIISPPSRSARPEMTRGALLKSKEEKKPVSGPPKTTKLHLTQECKTAILNDGLNKVCCESETLKSTCQTMKGDVLYEFLKNNSTIKTLCKADTDALQKKLIIAGIENVQSSWDASVCSSDDDDDDDDDPPPVDYCYQAVSAAFVKNCPTFWLLDNAEPPINHPNESMCYYENYAEKILDLIKGAAGVEIPINKPDPLAQQVWKSCHGNEELILENILIAINDWQNVDFDPPQDDDEDLSEGEKARCEALLENALSNYCKKSGVDCKNMANMEILKGAGVLNASAEIAMQNLISCEDFVFAAADRVKDRVSQMAGSDCTNALAKAENAQKCYQIIANWDGGASGADEIESSLHQTCSEDYTASKTVAQAFYKAGSKGSADWGGKLSSVFRGKFTDKNPNWQDEARNVLVTVAQEAMKQCPETEHAYLRSIIDMKQVAVKPEEKNLIADATENVVAEGGNRLKNWIWGDVVGMKQNNNQQQNNQQQKQGPIVFCNSKKYLLDVGTGCKMVNGSYALQKGYDSYHCRLMTSVQPAPGFPQSCTRQSFYPIFNVVNYSSCCTYNSKQEVKSKINQLLLSNSDSEIKPE